MNAMFPFYYPLAPKSANLNRCLYVDMSLFTVSVIVMELYNFQTWEVIINYSVINKQIAAVNSSFPTYVVFPTVLF